VDLESVDVLLGPKAAGDLDETAVAVDDADKTLAPAPGKELTRAHNDQNVQEKREEEKKRTSGDAQE
jgi:hypothetical protein